MLSGWNEVLADRLRELGNIGCGHALKALSQMTSEAFAIRVPDIALMPYSRVPDMLGDPEQETVCVTLDVTGGMYGMFMLLMHPLTAQSLLSSWGVTPPRSFRRMDERQRSALLELGNILCSSYMTAISEMTGLDIRCSVPYCAADMLGAILSLPIIRFAEKESDMLYIQNVFSVRGVDREGRTLLLPEPQSAATLSERLGARI